VTRAPRCPSRPPPLVLAATAFEIASLVAAVLELRLEETVQPVAHILLVMPAHVLVGDDGHQLLQPRLQFGAFASGVSNWPVLISRPQIISASGLAWLITLSKRRAPLVAHQIVGILAVRQKREADGAPGFICGSARSAARLAARMPAPSPSKQSTGCGVILPQQLELVFGERRAERRHGILDAGLMQRDHVHIAFDGDDRAVSVRPCARTRARAKL
jgi:hypothetical protein